MNLKHSIEIFSVHNVYYWINFKQELSIKIKCDIHFMIAIKVSTIFMSKGLVKEYIIFFVYK